MKENKNDHCCISSDLFSCNQFLVKVIFQKGVRVFHWVSQHEKKIWKHEAAGRVVLFFHFRVFGNSVKLEVQVFEITSPTIKYNYKIISLISCGFIFREFFVR